ncbi:MAG TPA: MlaD family protein [Candidatus Omnitrophota bacterium]|nr:MlaD family protein [Candidatus Omnitrophota bacterium]HPS36473.1 MlaD family protein [Candidatus Omnitrophota bacterium]
MDSANSYSSSEIRSGFFVLLVLIMLLVLTFVVGGYFKGGADAWQVRFGYLSGLEDNAPVYYAGREVGKVEKIELVRGSARPVLVTVKVSADAYIRKDTAAYIDTLGMMGEKFIELSTGSQTAPALAPGTIIEGTDPIPMHVLIRKMNLLADEMEKMVGTLNPLLKTVNQMAEGHSEEISKSITNIHEVTANLRDMTADLKLRPWRLLRKGS